MPTADPGLRLLEEQADELIARTAFAPAGLDDQRGVGLEVEFFSLHPGREGIPVRTGLGELAGRLDDMARDGDLVRRGLGDRLRAWPAASGRLTFEPGGQIEYSGGPQPTGAAALDDVDVVVDRLQDRWRSSGDALVSIGMDPWSDVDDIPQQLLAPRYVAMDAYLARRGGAGRRMMRNTASIQVNLDPGRGEEAERRWLLANLAAPLVTASFATSPAPAPDTAVSLRARAWRQLDDTRTGTAVHRPLAPSRGRLGDWRHFALHADVLLVPTPDGDARPGWPGRTFLDWIRHGDDEAGWPTAADLEVHLSTLFADVRPRGALEIRSIDGLPARWRAVPVVLLTGLLYDETAADEARRLLEPRAGQLRDDLARAGEVGLKDAALCAAAVEVWTEALRGARRLGPGWHRPGDLAAAEHFIDHFTLAGRCPADDLRERLARDPLEALNWVAEPAADAVLDLR